MEKEDKNQEEEERFTISVKIKCSDGGELEPAKPDATLTETRGGALKAFAAFSGAFIGAFMKEIKQESAKKEKGDIEKIEFTLSNEKGFVKEKMLSKEEIEGIEEITKK